MIKRDLTKQLAKMGAQFPAITLTGPRQSGKSTLCKAVFPEHAYVNLEALDTRSFALEDPRGFLAQFKKGVILDEIQRAGQLTSYIQELIDEDPGHRQAARWVLTGSQNLSLIESVSQSLAGRTAVLHLLPLVRSETIRFAQYPKSIDQAILTGDYPRILDQNLDSSQWLDSYITTYLERDVRMITNIGDLAMFQRFLELCAGRTGQLLNFSQLGNDCGVSQPTAKAWLSVLEASFIVFRLPAFSSNIKKRLVKMPKLHFYDTGLACQLLGIRTVEHLNKHPLRGALFESWVVSQIIKHRINSGRAREIYHYRDQHGTEADTIIEYPDHFDIIEAKAGQTINSSMLKPLRNVADVIAQILPAKQVAVYGGDQYQKRSDIEIVPWSKLHELGWS